MAQDSEKISGKKGGVNSCQKTYYGGYPLKRKKAYQKQKKKSSTKNTI